MPWPLAAALEAGLTVIVTLAVTRHLGRRAHAFDTDEERATMRTLAFATQAVSTLRQGLTAKTAGRVLRSLVSQSAGLGVALYDSRQLLAFQAAAGSRADAHAKHLPAEGGEILASLLSGRTQLVKLHPGESAGGCPLRVAVVSPIVLEDRPVAGLVTFHAGEPGPAQLRITSDLAELLATQLRLQRADQQQAALVRSELRALRAQISPHFIYNTLATIASFVRTDPERARELLTEFADFSRRAFSGPASEFTTLADELVYVNQYLTLEQARFGNRLHRDRSRRSG
jgi:two-component system LytT family sensor kinase